MTSTEFIHWLKGFTEGCHEYAPTPKQWDLLKERLLEVYGKESGSTSTNSGVVKVGVGGTGVLNISGTTSWTKYNDENATYLSSNGTPFKYKVNSDKDEQ